jgi:hypothetical protein
VLEYQEMERVGSQMPESDRHEKRDIKVVRVAVVGVALLSVIALAGHVIPWLVFKIMSEKTQGAEAPSPLAEMRQLPPPPRLQPHPQRDMARLRAAAEQQLNSYSWVDRPNGVVRIPIERAMNLILERGLPRPQPLDAAKPPAKKP